MTDIRILLRIEVVESSVYARLHGWAGHAPQLGLDTNGPQALTVKAAS